MTRILLHPAAYKAATDEQLVARVRSGDGRAFDAIHARYRPQLVAYARRFLDGAHHDAEEVVQDAFLRALAALMADSRQMALRPWLYAIVRNRAFDVRRRPVRTTDLAPLAPVLPDAAADPHERAIRREELQALMDGVLALPPRQRQALVMHELGGAAHGSIARELRVSRGASKALVNRARSGLARSRLAA
jgi:RNA polymerase sigma-70 factor (ECF subfamily)